MEIRTDKAASPILNFVAAGFALGFGYGVIRSANLSVVGNILTFGVICLVQWLIFKQGAKSSYSQAQAWAQAQVDVAVEVYNTATAKANALSAAYATAISNAQATATNQVTVNLPDNSIRMLQEETERELNAGLNLQSSEMAMGEFNAQEFEIVRPSTNI